MFTQLQRLRPASAAMAALPPLSTLRVLGRITRHVG